MRATACGLWCNPLVKTCFAPYYSWYLPEAAELDLWTAGDTCGCWSQFVSWWSAELSRVLSYYCSLSLYLSLSLSLFLNTFNGRWRSTYRWRRGWYLMWSTPGWGTAVLGCTGSVRRQRRTLTLSSFRLISAVFNVIGFHWLIRPIRRSHFIRFCSSSHIPINFEWREGKRDETTVLTIHSYQNSP